MVVWAPHCAPLVGEGELVVGVGWAGASLRSNGVFCFKERVVSEIELGPLSAHLAARMIAYHTVTLAVGRVAPVAPTRASRPPYGAAAWKSAGR